MEVDFCKYWEPAYKGTCGLVKKRTGCKANKWYCDFNVRLRQEELDNKERLCQNHANTGIQTEKGSE